MADSDRRYSSLNTFTWTPPAGTNAVQVWVRSAGSSAPYDAYAATGYFDIRSGARVTAFFANRSFPLPVHVPVTFTANASSGSGAVQYQFWRYSASTGWISRAGLQQLELLQLVPARRPERHAGLGANRRVERRCTRTTQRAVSSQSARRRKSSR